MTSEQQSLDEEELLHDDEQAAAVAAATAQAAFMDPMQLVEERLIFIEELLEEDVTDEELLGKREEYYVLLEELDHLSRRLRKNLKLLRVPNQPNHSKLMKKRQQYEREVVDIVHYVTDDVFFSTSNPNNNSNAQTHAQQHAQQLLWNNSLLGKSLDTLTEVPGMEDSSASLNFNYKPNAAAGKSMDASAFLDLSSRSTGGAELGALASNATPSSKPHITVLKKKLNKIKKLLQEDSDAISESMKAKLLAKQDEYSTKLQAELEAAKQDEDYVPIEEEEDDDDDDDDDDVAHISVDGTDDDEDEEEEFIRSTYLTKEREMALYS